MGWVILIAFVLIFWLWVSDYPRAPHREDLARIKGQHGEAIVRDILLQACRERTGHVLSNVTLSWQGRTTQIDHILINPSGIFVLEVKHRSGEIIAPWNHPTWTQVTTKGHYEFQNPLMQNATHCRAVDSVVHHAGVNLWSHNCVVLTGDATLIPQAPYGVLSVNGLRLALRAPRPTMLTPATMRTCVKLIEAARKPATKRTERQHIAYVKSVQRRLHRWH